MTAAPETQTATLTEATDLVRFEQSDQDAYTFLGFSATMPSNRGLANHRATSATSCSNCMIKSS